MCSLLKGCHYRIKQLNRFDAFSGLADVACGSVETSKPSDDEVKTADEAFYTHRQMVAITCCQWLPLLPDNDAVVATATRSGHLVVWDVAVPVVPQGRLSVLSVMDVAAGKDLWVCSMCWCLCNREVRLFLGCTDGSVHLAKWEEAGDLLAGRASDQGLVEIWAPDDIGVHQIAWQPVDHLLAISKGSMLVFLSVPPILPSSLPIYSYSNGLHNLPISGLCALLSGGFLSCSLDGSVQKCCVARDGRCVSSEVGVEPLKHGHPHSAYGIATSSGSVFAAVVLRPDLEFSPKGMKFQSHVQFVKLADDSNVIKCLEEKGVSGRCGVVRWWSDEVWSDEVWSDEVWSGEVWSVEVWSGEVWSGEVWRDEVWSDEVWSDEVWSVEVWSGEVWSDEGGVMRCGVVRCGVVWRAALGGVVAGGVLRCGVPAVWSWCGVACMTVVEWLMWRGCGECSVFAGFQWDTGEYIRQHYVTHESAPSFISANSSLMNDLRLRRHLELTAGSDATAVTRTLQYRHVLTSLRHWVEWKGKGGAMEGERGTVSLHRMVQWVQTNLSASEEELSLSHKVSEGLHQSECEETCPICGCTVNDTTDALCAKGHPFLMLCSLSCDVMQSVM
eukprot:Em0004g381a